MHLIFAGKASKDIKVLKVGPSFLRSNVSTDQEKRIRMALLSKTSLEISVGADQLCLVQGKLAAAEEWASAAEKLASDTQASFRQERSARMRAEKTVSRLEKNLLERENELRAVREEKLEVLRLYAADTGCQQVERGC